MQFWNDEQFWAHAAPLLMITRAPAATAAIEIGFIDGLASYTGLAQVGDDFPVPDGQVRTSSDIHVRAPLRLHLPPPLLLELAPKLAGSVPLHVPAGLE